MTLTRPDPPVAPLIAEPAHLLVALVYLFAVAVASLNDPLVTMQATTGTLVSVAIILAATRMWGDRTRPKLRFGWILLAIAWGIYAMIQTFTITDNARAFTLSLLIGLPVALTLRHDTAIGPTLLIAAPVWLSLALTQGILVGPLPADDEELMHALRIAGAVLLGIIAATIHHERLISQQGTATSPGWTTLRIGFLAAWTLVILLLREQIPWGTLFLHLGIDLQTQAGRFLLIAILFAATAITAYALRPVRKDPGGPHT